ncbi:carboxypeptidase regulatory-like domain-containing protein [Terriglobus saanensis]|uniref:TonB-dependent receptor plug n=1 Tax=Terriglobus saanensis (strain ATCC BAA-1853 / DSM 23119 / SP1PR4) TaxID=401053 RepID=E8V0E4_TERSS|nr:carboxypeptidase regulatory-like domain-containing protein [Terriglobus saanensis]ADV84427.1 TonB-dependent receptor plug [Terriglobus saanensis SP1PR4]
MRRFLNHWKRVALVVLILTAGQNITAQSDNSSLTGAVTDSNGAALPNAKVVAHDVATGQDRDTTTNESGNYNFVNVRPSRYTVTVTSPGFRTASVSDVQVDASIGRRVDVALKVGEAGTSITVEAGANAVQTESASVGQLVTQEQVKSIQLNGRNPLYLSQMEPGVVRNNSMAAFAFSLDNGINVGGARSQESVLTLDGAPMVRTRSNGTSVGVADVDSTSQIQILTNSYPAEFGRASGGQIRMVPKSGTSSFHGSVYEFFRNTALNANTWQRKLTAVLTNTPNKPAAFRYNQFGWNFNGPVTFPHFNTGRQKLFFLAGQEFVKYNHDDTATQFAPTARMRTGDFGELLSPNIFYSCLDAGGNTTTGTCVNNQIKNPLTGVPYANNDLRTVPGSTSANGLGLLNAYPLPNVTGSSTYNWSDTALYTESQRKDTIVVDFVPTESQRFRFSLLNFNYDNRNPHSGNFNRTPQTFHRPNQVAVFHYQWTISPTMVNELVVSAAADHVKINIDRSSGLYDRTSYGINYPYLYGAATKQIPNKIPTIQISNFGTLDGLPYPSSSGGIVYGAADNFTKVWGNHTLKAGFNFEYAGENNFDQISVSSTTPGATNNQNGFFRFTDTRGGTAPTTGRAVANAAAGLFDTYGEIGTRSYTLYRGTMYEGFVQDQWRARSNLVIEMGVRYSIMNPYYAKWGNLSVFNPGSYSPALAVTVNPITDAVTGGDQYNGVVIPGSGFPSSAAGHVDPSIIGGAYSRLFRGFSNTYSPTVKSNVQPRVGFAWQVDPKTVVRAGGGRYFQRLGISDNVFTGGNAPFQPSSTVTNGSVDTPGGVGTNSFPFNYSSQAFNYPSPEAYAWNFTVEQEFDKVGTFTLAYVGRRGIHLEQLANINQLQPGTTQANPGIQPDALRPFKGFSNITETQNKGASMYHSLQANLKRRLTNNLLLGIAYTWSKSMDFGSSNGTNLTNAFDKSISYGPSDFDTRHVFVSNFVYNIPYGTHATHFIERAALGNWQFSGTLQAQTGPPENISISGADYAGVGQGSGTQFYRHLGSVHTYKGFAGQTGTDKWFDTSVYPSPAQMSTTYAGQFSPRGSRNQIYGPGFQSYSAALQKTMHLIPNHENHALVFRGEAFNLANHPTADNPNTTPGSSTFGLSKTKGQTYGADRQLQFSLRYAF